MSPIVAFQRLDALLLVALLVGGFCCCCCDARKDASLRSALRRLERGEDGRGNLQLRVRHNEMRINDELLLRIGATTVSGLGMMDLVSMETSEDGKATAKLRFPQLRLSSSIHIFRPPTESSTSGEAILRFLDVDLHLEGVADEVALKRVELTLDVGTVATAFDLETLDPAHSAGLQAELNRKKDHIGEFFKRLLERKIVQVLETAEEETSALSVDVPAAAESSVQKANRFVDQILKDNRQVLRDAISTIKLPDEYFKFSKKILFVETHGYAKLTNGHLDNLHALSRKRDCVFSAKNDVLNVDIGLGLDNVLGAYLIDVKFGIFGATSDLKLKIETVELIIHGINSFRETRDQKEPENVLDFDLAVNIKANLGEIDVDVNISAAIDWLVNFIAEKVVSNLKKKIQGMIKDPIRDAINSIINGGKLFK